MFKLMGKKIITIFHSKNSLAEPMLLIVIFEPRHGISNNVVCATSKVSDQPAHTGSLIRAFSNRFNIL